MNEKVVAYRLNIHNGDKIWLGALKDLECYYLIQDGVAIRKRFEFLDSLRGLKGSDRFYELKRLCDELGEYTQYQDYIKLLEDYHGLSEVYCDKLEGIIIERMSKLNRVKEVKDCVSLKYTYEELKSYYHTRLPWHDTRKCIVETILSKLRDGVSVKDIKLKIIERIKEEEVEKVKEYENNSLRLLKDINYFVTRIDTPTYERETGNNNKNTFDFVRVFVNLPSTEVMNKESIRIGLNTHYKEMCDMILKKIASMKRYQRFGVPVTALKLSKATVEYRTNRVMFIFELKDDLRKLS